MTVDGIEVFRDTTMKSLGYFDAVCKPTKGRKVSIDLLRPASERNTQFIEVSGKKLDDGIVNGAPLQKRRLSIIEVQVYENAGAKISRHGFI